MGKKYNFDYIIIGSGPAGSTAALTLAKSKKHIAIIEQQNFGGNHLNSRDIPYKVSLGFSHTFSHLSNRPEISGQELHYNFPTIVSHQSFITSTLSDDRKKELENAGVTCINGYANFLDKHTVAVGDQKYTADYFILATGSELKTSEIAGLDTVNYLTPSTAIKVRRLPKFVFVIGGGPSGCEIAEYFAELGAKVLIMERAGRILPHEDKEVSSTIKDYFTNELGIMVVPSARVVAVSQDGPIKRVIFNINGQEKMVRVDCIVLATGSSPITDYGLENAGVKYKRTGIGADSSFRTSQKHIFAIGDALGGPSSTERAEYQASILANNILRKSKNPINYTGFIRITNTCPEIATVGSNELELSKQKKKFKKSIVYLNELLPCKAGQLDYGFVKILADRSGHILGATIVAPNAGLMAEEIAMAIRHHLTALEIASTPHISDSPNYAIKLAAKKLIK
ncbi:NAD(P)/FAD-dependent oxidoreductase [Candidatus Saccharibacteria bacterium]|nr:NAD(P)/FAD-dependent oxidoreductase [Candidatus Saccharibacteria bacterium]